MFDRLAELAIRRARLVLAVAFVAVVLMGALGVGVFGKLKGAGSTTRPRSPAGPRRSSTGGSAGRRTWS